MRRASILANLLPPLLVVLVIALLLITGFTGRSMRGFVLDHTQEDLVKTCHLLESQLGALIVEENYDAIQEICHEVMDHSGERITIVLPGGRVVADSEQDPDYMDNHANRPEIMASLLGRVGHSTRYSSTLKHQRLYVAIPGSLPDPERDVGYVIRASVSLESLSQLVRLLYRDIALAGLVLFLVSGGIYYFVARRFAVKLQHLRDGAEDFAAGNLEQELKINDPVEMADLAHSMNTMARQLDERIAKTENQRQELAAVLASMVEGVIAVNTNENVIRMNAVAGEMFGVNNGEGINKSIQEIGHSSQLTKLAQKTLSDYETRTADVFLGGARSTVLEVQASGLVGAEGNRIGALLVCNDVTRIRRLQTMRRDFVANVSHELKTPITSIKGFVETLLESPPEDKPEMDRFLGIINRQADRLGNIINDLLALSRLEQTKDQSDIEFFELPLTPILERVVRDTGNRKPDQADRLRLECDESLRATVNGALLEQAIGNLIDNALKYGGEDSPVVIKCRQDQSSIMIDVIDEGPGIGAQHLPRVFERFYRVDKARSRQVGGTGLGLAIVKHIAQAHGGLASATSEPGEGSTFTIALPKEVSA